MQLAAVVKQLAVLELRRKRNRKKGFWFIKNRFSSLIGQPKPARAEREEAEKKTRPRERKVIVN